MAAAATALHAFPLKLRASWDTQHRLPYNPHRTYPKNPSGLTPVSPNTEQPIKSNSTDRNLISVSALLSRKSPSPGQVRLEETYMGYETWMPSPPKVEKPRSTYNAASLAYIGDCIYEVFH